MTQVEVGMDVHLILWLVLRARDDTQHTHVGVMYTRVVRIRRCSAYTCMLVLHHHITSPRTCSSHHNVLVIWSTSRHEALRSRSGPEVQILDLRAPETLNSEAYARARS